MIRLEIAEIAKEISTWRAGAAYRDKEGARQSISFLVYPSGRDHIDLKSGEIFRNPSYARLYKTEDKSITGWLTCYRQADFDEGKGAKLSRVQYGAGSTRKDDPEGRASEIFMTYVLPDADFDVLSKHILAGSFPRTVSFDVEEDALEFGWEPDGSGQKWNNEARPLIGILGITFGFKVHERPDLQDDLIEPDNRASFADAPRVAWAALTRMGSLQTTLREILWIAVVMALIMLWQLVSHHS